MIKKFLEFILFGSIFIAFCTVGMSVETNLLLHLPLNNIGFYAFIFGATLLQYNLHYLLKRTAANNSEHFYWSKQNKRIHRILIAIAVILITISLFTFDIDRFIFLSFLGMITLLYSVPVLPFKNRKRIKDFGLLKIITLVLLWTIVTVWLPVQQVLLTSPDFVLIFLSRFIFLFVLCLLFDIRDVEVDRGENIRTIPIITGVKTAYSIARILMVIFIILSSIQYFRGTDLLQFNAMLVSAAATLIMIEFTKKTTSDFVYLICIDGMMFLQAMLVIIGYT